jgi:hypothetical protein
MSYWVVARYLLDVIFLLSIRGTQTLIISDILLVVCVTPLVAAVVVEVVKGAIARFAEPCCTLCKDVKVMCRGGRGGRE